MNHFEVTGWIMPTLRQASEKALLVLDELAVGADGFGIEVHCKDFDTLKRLAEVAPSDRCALYCWKPVIEGHDFTEKCFSLMRRARLVFRGATVSCDDDASLPPYDWDASEPTCSIVTLTTLHPVPLKPGDKTPSLETIELLSRLAADNIGIELGPVHTSTGWEESGREHSYIFTVPRDRLPAMISAICSGFNLRDGFGSFKYLSRPNQLAAIYQNPRFRFENFPSMCWNLNRPEDTVFSYGISSLLRPWPMIQRHQLLLVASTVDQLKQQVGYHSVVKDYLAWKLSGGTVSPQVRRNYLLISPQRVGGYAIFLGYERYEDKDPPASKFIRFAEPIIEKMGAQLKRVAGPR